MRTKAALFTRLPGSQERRVEVADDADLGDLLPDEVLVRVGGAGICQTDIKILHGQFRESDDPAERLPERLIAGHEMAGVVEALGDEAACRAARSRFGFEPLVVGDAVVLDPNIFCAYQLGVEQCEFCRENDSSRCTRFTALGVNRNGGFARFCRVPAAQLLRVPDERPSDFDLRLAAFAEPLTCVLWGIERAGIVEGDTVVIQGGGPIGLLMAQAARLAGAWRTVVTEPSAERRAIAADVLCGPDLAVIPPDEAQAAVGPCGADVVIECAGAADTLQQALELARPGGTVEYFAVSPQGRRVEVEPYLVFVKQLTVVGSCIYPDTPPGRPGPHRALMTRALRMLLSGQVRVAPLLTHIHPLEDVALAIEQIERGEGLKHQVDPWL
jgi:threonine dehydrogenase-like Zn-dependent dehydrogenase